MKAKEYAEKFIKCLEGFNGSEEDLKNILNDVCKKFLQEVTDIGKTRDIGRDAALFSILDEQNAKWKAFARIVNDHYGVGILLESGFEEIHKESLPDIYHGWQSYKQRLKTRKQLIQGTGRMP